MQTRRLLVTGGAGFIGSAVVRECIAATGMTVINVDKLTYAANLNSLADARRDPRHRFEQVDICQRAEVERVFREHRPDAVMHLAAESHVDRSILGPDAFVDTNVVGTSVLLEVAREYWSELPAVERDGFRFHHVSTDEVYGDLADEQGAASESTAYAPSSPYSASKAAADHLVRAWHRTYGLPTLITNCSNNYGPYQFPEKLIPLMLLNALDGKPLPVYGEGTQVRDWLYVEDHARALLRVLQAGRVGETYNIGGCNEMRNIDVVYELCALLDRHAPERRPDGASYASLIRFVTDRPGHDRRYAIDAGKIGRELGWTPSETFTSGLERTVRWYLDNPLWVQQIRSGSYREWLDANYSRRPELDPAMGSAGA